MINLREKAIFSLTYRKTSIPHKYEKLKKIEFLPRTEIETISKTRLEKLLLHAYHQVPYYQKIFKKINLIQNNKVNLDKFNEIPILTKEIIRKEKDNLYSLDRQKRDWYQNTSGGSTGEPLIFIQDRHYSETSLAQKLVYDNWVGNHIGCREIKLWGSERDIFKDKRPFRSRWEKWLSNQKLLNTFSMSENNMFRYVKIINKFKPQQIISYVDSAYELARFIEKNNLVISNPPKALVVTAGTLYPKIKNYLSKIFKSTIYNQYGSREASDLAFDCPQQYGLHVFEYLNKLEIINGQIHITCLTNYSMPLIRYQIGDTASWNDTQKCSCGRNLRLISNVHGRITDHFKKKDGAIIHGEYFTHLFYFRPWVKKFQIVQKKHDDIQCFIILETLKNEKDIADIKQKIKLVMGDNCQISFNFVDNIPINQSGKYLYTISEIT